MIAGAVSTSAGSVHVALWGNGAVPSALKCHETGAIFSVPLGQQTNVVHHVLHFPVRQLARHACMGLKTTPNSMVLKSSSSDVRKDAKR